MHQVWHGHKCRNAEQSDLLDAAEAPAAAETLQRQPDFMNQSVTVQKKRAYERETRVAEPRL